MTSESDLKELELLELLKEHITAQRTEAEMEQTAHAMYGGASIRWANGIRMSRCQYTKDGRQIDPDLGDVTDLSRREYALRYYQHEIDTDPHTRCTTLVLDAIRDCRDDGVD